MKSAPGRHQQRTDRVLPQRPVRVKKVGFGGHDHCEPLRAEMPSSKLSAGTGLEVMLESNCPSLLRKRVIAHQIPSPVFRCVRGLAGIVIVKMRPQVTGLSNIPFIRLVHRFENVNVVHWVTVRTSSPPTQSLRRGSLRLCNFISVRPVEPADIRELACQP